jgi:hypothetical protein
MKTTGQKAKLVYPDKSHYSRYFWGEDSYKQAVQWVDKFTKDAEERGVRPHVTIIAVSV